MPKWLLYGLVAVGNFVAAALTYRAGRVLVPLILVVAGLLMAVAAVGSAREARGGN